MAATQMKEILVKEKAIDNSADNIFNARARMAHLDSVLKTATPHDALRINYQRAKVFMEKGDIDKTVELFNSIHNDSTVIGSDFDMTRLEPEIAFAYLRMGEVYKAIRLIKNYNIHANFT